MTTVRKDPITHETPNDKPKHAPGFREPPAGMMYGRGETLQMREHESGDGRWRWRVLNDDNTPHAEGIEATQYSAWEAAEQASDAIRGLD